MILECTWSALLFMHSAFVLQRLWFIRNNELRVEKSPKYRIDVGFYTIFDSF